MANGKVTSPHPISSETCESRKAARKRLRSECGDKSLTKFLALIAAPRFRIEEARCAQQVDAQSSRSHSFMSAKQQILTLAKNALLPPSSKSRGSFSCAASLPSEHICTWFGVTGGCTDFPSGEDAPELQSFPKLLCRGMLEGSRRAQYHRLEVRGRWIPSTTDP